MTLPRRNSFLKFQKGNAIRYNILKRNPVGGGFYCTDRGTKKERKLHTRFEKRSEIFEMLRDLSQKKKEESVLEEVGTDPKSSGRRAREGRL